MAQRTLLTLALLAFLSTPALGDPLPVLQPNETSYSAAELTVLLSALERLDEMLSDANLGSQRIFRPHDWNSLGFSAHTSGTIEKHGYTTRLVAADGWPDGVHAWVLVGTLLSERTAWTPMESSPNLGEAQLTPSTIPTTIDPAGRLWFASSYLDFSDEIHLSPNAPPVAVIRTDTTRSSVGQAAMFMALAPYNPDGEIVRYYWDLGDGTNAQARTVLHPFKEAADCVISLTATDSRGASGTTSTALQVAEPRVTSDGFECGK